MKFLVWFVVLSLSAFIFHELFGTTLQRGLFQRRVKQRVNAEEIQSWALKIIREMEAHDPPLSQSSEFSLHPALHGLFRQPPGRYWYRATDADTAFVRIIYGGGAFGHFGLEIGPTNRLVPAGDMNYRRYFHWAPGVDFFDGQ